MLQKKDIKIRVELRISVNVDLNLPALEYNVSSSHRIYVCNTKPFCAHHGFCLN